MKVNATNNLDNYVQDSVRHTLNITPSHPPPSLKEFGQGSSRLHGSQQTAHFDLLWQLRLNALARLQLNLPEPAQTVQIQGHKKMQGTPRETCEDSQPPTESTQLEVSQCPCLGRLPRDDGALRQRRSSARCKDPWPYAMSSKPVGRWEGTNWMRFTWGKNQKT